MSFPVKLKYPFTPVPERATLALRTGELSPMDFCLLAVLYERADTRLLSEREETPRTTLAQLAETLHWTASDDALSKRLRRLRAKPGNWLSYRTEGRGRYVFTLHPELSEAGPRSEAESCPRRDELGLDLSGAIRQVTPSGVSEIGEIRPPASGPSSCIACPRSQSAVDGYSGREPALSTEDEVRGSQRFERRSPLNEGAVNGEESVAWPDTHGLRSEEAILADCDALVLSGRGEWLT